MGWTRHRRIEWSLYNRVRILSGQAEENLDHSSWSQRKSELRTSRMLPSRPRCSVWENYWNPTASIGLLHEAAVTGRILRSGFTVRAAEAVFPKRLYGINRWITTKATATSWITNGLTLLQLKHCIKTKLLSQSVHCLFRSPRLPFHRKTFDSNPLYILPS